MPLAAVVSAAWLAEASTMIGTTSVETTAAIHDATGTRLEENIVGILLSCEQMG